MHSLFSQVRLGRHTLSNRMIMAPMTRSRSDDSGVPGELVSTYYAQRAGAGLIISEGVFPVALGKGYVRTPVSKPPSRWHLEASQRGRTCSRRTDLHAVDALRTHFTLRCCLMAPSHRHPLRSNPRARPGPRRAFRTSSPHMR